MTMAARSPAPAWRTLVGGEHRWENAFILGLILLGLFLGASPGVYLLGVVSGAVLALNAFGLVLVYRSNGFVNFAQIAVGATVGTLFSIVVRARTLPRFLQSACAACIDSNALTPIQRTVDYVVALVIAIALSALLSWLTYNLVIRRFRDRAPMMLSVASVFVAQTVVRLVDIFDGVLITRDQRDRGLGVEGVARLPFRFNRTIGGVVFQAPDLLAVVLVVVAGVGIVAYLRMSATGTAVRASAENPARARTLGIPVERVASRVWLLAGLLSGMAGLLGVMGGAIGGLSEPTVVVQVLVIGVLARMRSLGVAAVAAIAIGILRQAVLRQFGSLTALDASLVVLLGIALLIRRQGGSRLADEEQAAMQAAREIRPIPGELRGLRPVRTWAVTATVLGGIVVLGSPWALSPAQTNLASVTMIFAVVGLSLLVTTGWAGQINLGQFGFAAVGAYAAAIVGLPFPLGIVVGGLSGAAVAALVGLPALRLRGLEVAVISLAFSVAVSAILLSPEYLGKFLPQTLRRPVLLGIDLRAERSMYYVCLAFLLAALAMVAGLRGSRTARALIAARDNERAAQAFAVNLVRARLRAFAISGFLAGGAGALFAVQQGGVVASSFLPQQSIDLFTMTVIGGLGAVWGPLLGALYVGLPSIFNLPPIYSLLTTGVGALVLLQALGSGGLASLLVAGRDAMLRRLATRERITVPSLVADTKDTGDTRTELTPKEATRGRGTYIPRRYALRSQWAMEFEARRASRASMRTGGRS